MPWQPLVAAQERAWGRGPGAAISRQATCLCSHFAWLMAPAKKAKTGETPAPGGQVVPADVPSMPSASAPCAPPKPELPSPEATDVDVLSLSRGIISWVKHTLRARLQADFPGFPDVALYQHAPLEIKKHGLAGELLSYKAAWEEELAMASFQTTHKYEAGGNLFWANPFPVGQDDAVAAGVTPSWPTIVEMAESMRPKPGASAPDSTVAKGKRVMFPVMLAVHAPSKDDFKGKTFPGSLRVVTGHAAIYAWFLAMYEALDNPVGASTPDDVKDGVGALWQAALTVTFQGHIVPTVEDLAILSMQKNNDLFLQAKILGDSFPGFARKLCLAMKGINGVANRLKKCQDLKIAFNGTVVHRTLLSAASMYTERVDDATHAVFMDLERKFGKDAFTSKFNNLNRVLQLCAKEAETGGKMWDGASTPALVRLVMHYIMWMLEHEKITGGGITVEWLDKTRDGHPGSVNKVLAKAQLVMQFKAMAAELPADSDARKELTMVLSKFTDYATFNTAFNTPKSDEASEEPEPFKKLRGELGKVAQQMLDFLFDVFDMTFDKDISALCAKSQGPIGLLPWTDLEGDAGKKYRDLVRQMGINKQTVSAQDGAPPASARSLKRALSCSSTADDEEESARQKEVQAERLRAWKDAQTTRKKYALVSTCKSFGSANDIQKWLEKQPAHSFVGKAGEQHRIFVFSADTFGTECDEPWQKTQASGKELHAILDFLKDQRGPYDVILTLDGRNYDDRCSMEPVMRSMRNVCEIWVVYKASKRLGRRAVAWASDTREVGWISLPVPRTQIKTKARENEAKGWAASTHDSNYTNLPQVPWDGLPQITLADKMKVLAPCLNAGDELPKPPRRIFDCDRGMPLYWQELKPVSFWEDILFCLDGKQVVDLSPGSGSCARACLRLGVEYVAACRTEAHASWLANILDRESCELIVKNESPLFEQDLGQLIKTHFSDVLDQLKSQKNAPDTAPEGDDE